MVRSFIFSHILSQQISIGKRIHAAGNCKADYSMKLTTLDRPIPDDTYWHTLRYAYFLCKAPHDPHDKDLLKTFFSSSSLNGALVPFEIQQGPYGRGLYSASSVVSAGIPVWTCQRYGIFRTKDQWRQFLANLPHDMQDDVVAWSYVLEWDKGDHVVGLDLEPASLMNHGSLNEYEGSIAQQEDNLEVVKVPGTVDDWHYVAKRDIAQGEEFLCDYAKFHVVDHSLLWFEEDWNRIVEKGEHY